MPRDGAALLPLQFAMQMEAPILEGLLEAGVRVSGELGVLADAGVPDVAAVPACSVVLGVLTHHERVLLAAALHCHRLADTTGVRRWDELGRLAAMALGVWVLERHGDPEAYAYRRTFAIDGHEVLMLGH